MRSNPLRSKLILLLIFCIAFALGPMLLARDQDEKFVKSWGFDQSGMGCPACSKKEGLTRPGLSTEGKQMEFRASSPRSVPERFSLTHEEKLRNYSVYLPLSYRRGHATPVVLVFHGSPGLVKDVLRHSLINEKANREGFIAVYPEGLVKLAGEKRQGSWNAGKCCGKAMEVNADDIGFIRLMLDQLEKNFSIDPQRIYATGISNGSLMAYRLACEMADRIAAVAPVSGQEVFENCQPVRPISIIHFHGTADILAPYQGGDCGRVPGSDKSWKCPSVQDCINHWKKLNGCAEDHVISYQKGKATCVTYNRCAEDSEVVLCTIEGAGHSWPGGVHYPDFPPYRELRGEISRDISANDVMWDFFKRHPLKKKAKG